MRYGIWPSADRTVEEVVKFAELARKKFFDSLWLDQGPDGLANAIEIAEKCVEKTKRVFYTVVYHPRTGDNLRDVGEKLVQFQKKMNGYGYVLMVLDEIGPIEQQKTAAAELGDIMVPLLKGEAVSVQGKLFSVTEGLSEKPEKPINVYLDSKNNPDLIKIAAKKYHGVISYPTIEYF
ncbi:MAG: hypothetical protein ACTSVM_05940, partial [Candidatus Ranarchaeia archaeon]